MSTPQTFYTVGGLDLSGIFQPYTTGNNAVTGYKISTGQDLSGIFQPYSGSGSKASVTNYFVYNYNGQGIKDLSDIFAPYNPLPYTTNGIQTNYNPFVTSAPNNGYTYILFNSSTTTYFNIIGTIPKLYYMIVGLGGKAQPGATSDSFSAGGAGGGAGGCWNNFIVDISGNYTITIPDINSSLSTTFINSSSTFTLTAQSGSFSTRGAVTLNGTDLSSASSTIGQFGVGGIGYSQNSTGIYPGSAGGNIFLNAGNTGNYLTFLGDDLSSNTLFGGGGGGGIGSNGYYNDDIIDQNGYNGGGGGGGAGTTYYITYNTGGIGINGSNGGNSSTIGGVGGNAFTGSTSIKGYGGGGGGGGAGKYSAGGSTGGNGGPAMILIYFKYP